MLSLSILYAVPQEATGMSGGIEAIESKISEAAEDSFDPGQSLPTPQMKDNPVLSEEQYSFNLDADQCLMTQPHRISVYPCQRIHDLRNQLSKS
jgi:hypothetical protein